jgi:hypothetical protein
MRADGCTCSKGATEHAPECRAVPLHDPRPWNETNPEWWKLNVETRLEMGGDLAWRWLVNEYAAQRSPEGGSRD